MSADPRLGTQIAGYRIESVLGRGGMSVVYVAEHTGLKRKAALKLLTPELAVDERFRERFVRESQMAAALDHPNIIPIYEAGETDGVLYIAMRYVRGTDLKALLGEQGALPPERALAICSQAAAALDAAHAEGLVHRDVKPANILLAPGTQAGTPEHVYLSDFGVTKRSSSRTGLTGTGQFIGTLDYAAPEQIEGRPLDARTDVYSLGCVLYECLTGEVPFPRDAEMAVLWAHMSQPPPKVTEQQPDLPEAIDHVVARAMAKSPDDRHPTCSDLMDAAREALVPRTARTPEDPSHAPGQQAPPSPEGTPGPQGPSGSQGPPKPGEPPTAPEAPGPSRKPVFSRNLLVPLAAIVVVGLILVLVPLATRGKSPSAPGGSPTPSAPVAAQQGLLVRIDPVTNQVAGKSFAGTGPAHVAVGEGSTWVADQLSGTVTRFDGDGKKIAVVTVAKGLGNIAVGFGSVWVANRNDGVLYRIDPQTNKVSNAIAVGIGVESVAIGRDAVWVTNTRDGYLARVDPGRNLSQVTARGLGGFSFVAASGTSVWLLTWACCGVVVELYRVDPASGKPTHAAQVVNESAGQGSPPAAMVLAGGSAWVTVSHAAKIIQTDLTRPVGVSDPDALKRIPTGKLPVAITADGAGFVWVANRGSKDVWKFSADAGQAITTISVPGTPTSIAAGNGGIWVTLYPRDASSA